MRYKATNGKIVNTDKMTVVVDLDFNGQYGVVDSILYRTRKSHNWYIVSESSWSGRGNISEAEAISFEQAAALVMEHCAAEIGHYPELKDVIASVVDE